MLEKPDVISALNNSNRKKSSQLTWNYIFDVSKILSYINNVSI